MDLGLTAMVAGSGWASGVNVYATIAVLGVLGRLDIGPVPTVLQRTDVIVIAVVLFALEFVADKVPFLDSFWDAVHTVVRPVGAAVLGLILSGDAENWQQAVSVLGAGGIATAAHAAKATTRLAINSSPEPASNIGVSLLEDGLVLAVVWFALTNPLVAIGLVTVLLIGGGVLTVALFRVARRVLRRRRGRHDRHADAAAAGATASADRPDPSQLRGGSR